jgi:predicted RNA methylase
MAITITPEVGVLLQRSAVDGTILRLPDEQLTRPMYEAVNRVIVALGGKWDKRKGGHVFPFDPAPKIAAALGNGNVVSRQQALQHFDTPADLARQLVAKLGDISSRVCLEPSAGRGRIVQALADAGARDIISVEIDDDNGSLLMEQGLQDTLIVGDFLAESPLSLTCHAVAMNPPFTRNQDIRHVRHAFACLKPGGLLAAIVSEHGFIGKENECVDWRYWLMAHEAEVEVIPAGAFKESGTGVQTRMIVMVKPA